MSAKLMPLALTRMRTSPLFGSGSGASRSCSFSGPPRPTITTCLMGSWLSEDLLHGLSSRELVDELVEVADLLHQRILDLLHPHPADDARDERGLGVDVRVGEELLESRSLIQPPLQGPLVESGEPLDDPVELV